jgi:MFS family permease
MAVTTVFGGPVLGQLSDRIGRRPTMLLGFTGAALGTLSVLTNREPFVSLGAVMFGLAFSGLVTLIAAYIGDHTTPAQFAAGFGTITVAFAIAQAVGPYLGGWLRDRRGDFVAVYAVATGVWVIGGLCCLGLVGARRRAAARTT